MAQTGFTPIQLYYSSTTSNAPTAGNLANGELAINITDGKLFYKDNANAVQVISWKTTPTSAGGTGLTSYTAGDTLYYASGTTLTKLAIGTAYQAFQVNAGATAPSWQPSATSVLTAQGDLLYASGANTLARLAKDANATRYLSNTGSSNNPAWAQINLTNGVTGTLPATSGGTGQSSYAIGDLIYADTTTTLAKLADVATGNALISGGVGVAPSWGKIGLTTHVSGTLPTANGGTNLTSFTANGVMYASSTSALATGSNLTFDGSNLASSGTVTGAGLVSTVNGTQLTLQRSGPSATNTIACGGSGELVFSNSSTNAFTLYNTFAFFPSATTTASAANAYINNGSAGYANQLLRSTSSAKYKTHIEDLQAEFSKKIYDLRTVWYRSTADADRKDWSWYGLIAEEVAIIEPRLVHWTYADDQYEYVSTEIDGSDQQKRELKSDAVKTPDGIQYDRISVLLLKELQTLRAEFDAYVAAHP